MRLRLSLLMFLQWAVPGSLVPLYSVRLEALGFSRMTTAVCCATQAVAAVLSSLVAGQVADRWLSAEKAMCACAALAGVDLWLLAAAREPTAVFLATLGFWLVTGPMLLLGTTICFAHLGDPERQFGPVRMWGTVGWVAVGWLVGGWLAQPDWLRPLLCRLRPDSPEPVLGDSFRLGGVVALALACYCLSLPPTPPSPCRSCDLLAPVEAIGLLRRVPFAVYCACVLGAGLTFPFTTQSAPLLLEQLGIPREWISRTLTLAQVTEVLLLAGLPMLLLRLGVRGTMVLGLVAWLAAMCVLAVGRPVGLVVASLGLNGLFVTGFLIAGQVYTNALAGDDMRASAQGLLTWCNGLGQLAGNLLAGLLREWAEGRVAPTFAVSAGITACMLLVFLAGFRRPAP